VKGLYSFPGSHLKVFKIGWALFLKGFGNQEIMVAYIPSIFLPSLKFPLNSLHYLYFLLTYYSYLIINPFWIWFIYFLLNWNS